MTLALLRFTVLMSYSSELAVHSCPLLCVAELGSKFFWCWSLLSNNNMAANLQRLVTVVGIFPHIAFERGRHGLATGNAARQ